MVKRNIEMATGNVEQAKPLSAEAVASAFIKHYLRVLEASPEDAHKFYKEESMLARPSADGKMKSVTTITEIKNEIMSAVSQEWKGELLTVYSQDSIMGSVIVGVTGTLTVSDDETKYFTQTFLLAPQEGGGFYVHNDLYQFIEINTPPEIAPPVDASPSSPIAPPSNDPAQDSSAETAQVTSEDQSDKSTSRKVITSKNQNDRSTSRKETAENVKNVKSTSKKEATDNGNKVADSSDGKSSLPAKISNKNEPPVTQPASNAKEDVKKESYASILTKESSPPSPPEISTNPVVRVSINNEKRSSVSPAPPRAPGFPVKSATPSIDGASANGTPENCYDAKSIHVKDLPQDVNHESLLEVVKKFGPVKLKNIQIREYPEDGYRYAFVEFDNLKSAQSALQVGSIKLKDKICEIQYKRSSNQGGISRGRSPSAKGGFRNGGGRDEHENRGNYQGEGRGYNHQRNGYFQDQPRGLSYAVRPGEKFQKRA